MSKTKALWIVGAVLVLLLIVIWTVRLFWFRPYSIDDFFERAYMELLLEDPEALAQTGLKDPIWIRDHEQLLTDESPDQTYRLAQRGKEILYTLEKYSLDDLTESQKVSYRVFQWFLKTNVDSEPFLLHDYPITHLSGAHLEIPRFMNGLSLRSRKDIERYLDRLRAIDEKFGTVIDALEERRKREIIPPTHILQRSFSICEEFYLTPVEQNPILKSFEQKLNDIAFLEPTKREQMVNECRTILQQEVLPAYRRLAQYLLQLESSSMAIAGVWHLPQGEEYYKNCILRETTLPLDPDSLYEVGKQELARLQSELELLQGQSNSKRTAGFTVSDSTARSEVLDHFRNAFAELQPKLPSYFVHLPQTELEVVELPQNRKHSGPMAFYVAARGPLPSIGKTYVNTWRWNSLPVEMATVFAYHEGIPGHHLQKSIQLELKQLPSFRRFLPFSAFEEGWAMYAEQLGCEIMDNRSTEIRMALLRSEMFRVARLLTDIGIHHKKWLREQAVLFMQENAGLSESEAEHEVDRYIVWPGQGCAYTVGLWKFRELRARAESELPEFVLREFHDVLLGEGSMPLTVLEQRVNDYNSEKQR